MLANVEDKDIEAVVEKAYYPIPTERLNGLGLSRHDDPEGRRKSSFIELEVGD